MAGFRWDTLEVPWRPSFGNPVQADHRLDSYRDRAALVCDDAHHQVMRLYVQVDSLRTQRSGRLWWRKWSAAREFVVLHMLEHDGAYNDALLSGDALTDELQDWSQGTFRYRGEKLELTWLDLEESATVREQMGLN